MAAALEGMESERNSIYLPGIESEWNNFDSDASCGSSARAFDPLALRYLTVKVALEVAY